MMFCDIASTKSIHHHNNNNNNHNHNNNNNYNNNHDIHASVLLFKHVNRHGCLQMLSKSTLTSTIKHQVLFMKSRLHTTIKQQQSHQTNLNLQVSGCWMLMYGLSRPHGVIGYPLPLRILSRNSSETMHCCISSSLRGVNIGFGISS